MNTHRCRQCNLPFAESEIREGKCPACQVDLTEEAGPASAPESSDAPTPPDASPRRLQVLVAFLTLAVFLLAGAVVWLLVVLHLAESVPNAEMSDSGTDADGLELKTANEQLKTARDKLENAQTEFDSKWNKVHAELRDLQATQKDTQEKLSQAEAQLQAVEKLALEAKAKPAAIPEEKTVEELKQAGDLHGLVSKLNDPRGRVRSQAAHALSFATNMLQGPLPKDFPVRQLIDACLRDPWKGTRVQAGHALMHVLNKTKNQNLLGDALPPLLDALNHQQVELDRRRHAAVALSAAVIRLERVDLLHAHVPDLLTATFKDPDEGVREYAGRALQHTLQKLDDQPTLTIAAQALTAQLKSEVPRARGYSAVMLSVVVRKIDDGAALKVILGPITHAVTNDPDKGVREYGGRAMRHIQQVLKAKPE